MKDLLNCHGKKFKAKIQGKKCKGFVFVEEDSVYLLQNVKDGGQPFQGWAKFQKAYSWAVGEGTKACLKRNSVTKFKLLLDEPELKSTDFTEVMYGTSFNSKTITDEILSELERAETKHPDWPMDIVYQVSIMNEESGEAIRAALHYVSEGGYIEEVRWELIQTAAMCIRAIKAIDGGGYEKRT